MIASALRKNTWASILLAVFWTGVIVAAAGLLIHPMPPSKTTVSITFDDGVDDQIAARSILARYRMHATFYIISSKVGQPGYLTLDQIRGLRADGNEIGSHTVHHVRLTDLHGDALRGELCGSRSDLQNMGFTINSISYPFGHSTAETEQVTAECGYRDARAGFGSLERIPAQNWYALHALASIQSNTKVYAIKERVQHVIGHGGGWVILIFHHICTRCNYWSITSSDFDAFLSWLHSQAPSGVRILSIDEVRKFSYR